MNDIQIEEKIALGALLGTIVCWLLPDFVQGILPGVANYLETIGRAVPALIGAIVLCLVTIKGKPVMSFNQWMKDYMEWGTVALVAAIGVMGNTIGDPATGIPQLLTNFIQPVATNSPLFVTVLIAVAWVTLQTNLMSNMVSMTLVYSVIVPVMASAGVGDAAAMGVVIAAASNLAFALPSATTSTALVVGSGWVPVPFLFRYGIILAGPMILLFTFVGYPYATFIFG